FKQIGIASNGFRFLPSHPLDVIGRLASTSYDLAIAECAVENIEATVAATLPTLRSGGVLLLLGTLLDGTLADAERTDRQSICAREADQYITSLAGVTAARLPVGAGATIITKHYSPLRPHCYLLSAGGSVRAGASWANSALPRTQSAGING